MPHKLTIAFVADPLDHFDPVAETTFFLMQEAYRRGWTCWHFEPKDLFVKNNVPHACATSLALSHKKHFTPRIIKQETLDLTTVHALFLRKDPPVDLNFIDHLSLLDFLSPQVFMINEPSSIKQVSEKIFPLYFKHIIPETLIAQSIPHLLSFIKQHKTVILKPLNQAGGRGVIKVTARDNALTSLLEILTEGEGRTIMAQRYIPAARTGDKRILILDGEPLGAFLRVPTASDFRGNLHTGARLKRCAINKQDQRIIKTLKPYLKALKLYFVGIDIIGGFLTEVNVTSPMGINEINRLYGKKIESTIMDWLEQRV